MSDPDAFITRPMPARSIASSAPEPSDFLALARRSNEASRTAWERLQVGAFFEE